MTVCSFMFSVNGNLKMISYFPCFTVFHYVQPTQDGEKTVDVTILICFHSIHCPDNAATTESHHEKSVLHYLWKVRPKQASLTSWHFVNSLEPVSWSCSGADPGAGGSGGGGGGVCVCVCVGGGSVCFCLKLPKPNPITEILHPALLFYDRFIHKT